MKSSRIATLLVCLCALVAITLFPTEKAYATDDLPGPIYIEQLNQITGSGYYIMTADDTITDTSGYLTIAAEATVWLDLNGHSVFIAPGPNKLTPFPIVNFGDLTITGNGEIQGAYTQVQRVITNQAGATLHIINGTFGMGGVNGACIWTAGTVYVDDGTFVGSRGVSIGASTGVAVINGGTFKQNPSEKPTDPNFYTLDNVGGTMIINDATVECNDDFGAVGVTQGGTLHIAGGTFTTSTAHALYVAAESNGTMPDVTVDGGTFTNVGISGNALFIDTRENTSVPPHQIRIQGGAFSVVSGIRPAVVLADLTTATPANLVVSGGLFSPLDSFNPPAFFPEDTGSCLVMNGGRVVENHTPYVPPQFTPDDYGHWSLCEVCKLPFGYEFHASSQWFSDGDNHYQVCSVCGKEHHIYEHADILEWQYDDHDHWLTCLVCELDISEGAHVMGAGVNVVNPTTTKTGLMIFPCEVCAFEMKRETEATLSPTGDSSGGVWLFAGALMVASTGSLLLHRMRRRKTTSA